MDLKKSFAIWKLENRLRKQLKLYMQHIEIGRSKADPIVQAVKSRITKTLEELAMAKGCKVEDLYVDYPGLALIEDKPARPGTLRKLAFLAVPVILIAWHFWR